ncbi:ABC transporter ATP-binding protein [Streptomyces barkulensis]|uniref:ABC transporter ATP-binding protein n=1 Tax=Streptomyces barkulensis TaxID=1257026 RepID=UPI001F108C83|nr:ABC transporter ATP-binding protein [Streptomyces barkulensis]
MNDPVLSVRDVSHGFPGRPVLAHVNLEVCAGSSVAVTGPSGTGKTTLLSCVLGLVRPDEGSILVGGTDITRLGRGRLAAFRARNLGMVFQFGELLPELSPLENVTLPALLAGTGRREARSRGLELLDHLGVPHHTATGALSGGERQRVAVARALVNRPTVLLADEPTGSLDTASRDIVADLLFSLPGRWDCALVVVTHDQQVARRADDVLDLAPAVEAV